MTDNFINDKKKREEIVQYIRLLLKEVNESIILKYFNNLKLNDISTKTSDDDFVSIADKKSEELIFEKLYGFLNIKNFICILYTSPSPRDLSTSRMPSSA